MMFEIIRYVNNYVQNFEDLRYIGGKQYHAVPKSCTGVSKLPVDFENVNSANIKVLLLVKREHTDIPCLDSVQPWDQIWKSPVANHRFEIIGAMPPNRTQVQEGSTSYTQYHTCYPRVNVDPALRQRCDLELQWPFWGSENFRVTINKVNISMPTQSTHIISGFP